MFVETTQVLMMSALDTDHHYQADQGLHRPPLPSRPRPGRPGHGRPEHGRPGQGGPGQGQGRPDDGSGSGSKFQHCTELE